MPHPDTQGLTSQADDALSCGDLQTALSLYEKVCELECDNVEAWMMRGVISGELGKLAESATHLGKAIELDPGYAEARYSLAEILLAQGDPNAAQAQLRQTVTIDPEFAEAWAMLGGIQGMNGDFESSAECCRRAIALQPDNIKAHMNLGNAALQTGDPETAAACYRTVCELQPQFSLPWLLLGRIARSMYSHNDAENCFRRALDIDPDSVDTLCELGGLIIDRGLAPDAVQYLQRAIALQPANVAAHAGIASAWQQQGLHEKAIESYRHALRLAPESADILTNLSNSYRLRGQLDEAEDCLREAIRIDPALAEAHNNLGSVLKGQGMMNEAVRETQQALKLKPGFIGAHSNLLLFLNYDASRTPKDIFEAHTEWGRAAEQRLTAPPEHANSRDPARRLRVGYVSPDLRSHPVASFLQPILAHHNAGDFHITCYAEVSKPDAVTEVLRGLSHAWRSTCGLSDIQVAELIRQDGIDILVDLAGHTANNRLEVFAAKSAPVQISYLGYPNTTGLTRIDYRFTDSIADPSGSQQFYTESLRYLDNGFSCYAPPDDVPDVVRLPALQNGYVTFGSMSNLCKVNDLTMDLWCDVLHAIPSSRFLFYRHLLKGRAREHLQREFERRGIAAERISLEANVPPAYRTLPFGKRYFGFFSQIDVVLDTLPWNGHTTTCEALWMGVPVITLTGDRHAGRICASVLNSAGLSHMIAPDTGEFVRIAVALSSDIDTLASLRDGLRPRMAASLLCDGPGFTRILERNFRDCWRVWCENHGIQSHG